MLSSLPCFFAFADLLSLHLITFLMFFILLRDMLGKTVDQSGRDLDKRIPYVLYAYQTSVQELTREYHHFICSTVEMPDFLQK